jgi:hypothetical protein
MAKTARWFGSMLLVLTLAASALAEPNQPSEATREQARALALQGYEALQRADYAAAEDLFRRANALVHAPTIVVDHARALVGLGRLVEAHERYELVLREGVSSNSPWSWQRAAEDAEKELAAIKPRLAWLTIRVSGPSKPQVQIDDKDVPTAALGVRRATDPGRHKVKVTASGYIAKQAGVNLAEGEARELAITLEADPESRAELEEERTQVRPQEVRTVTKRASNRTLPYVLLGIGGAGLATGTVTGLMALGVRSDLDRECPDHECHPLVEADAARYQKDIDRYRLLGTVSGVSFAAGFAAAATGAVLLWLGGGDGEEAAPAAAFRAAPFVSLGEAGVRGSF